MENARTAGSAGTGHPQPSRPSCHGFVRSRWVRESQRLKLLLQETRASKKAPRSRGLSVSIKRNRSLDVEETAQLLRAARVAQLSQRLGLYLADPLAGDVELLADFLEGVVGVHVDAEAHAQHLGLARGQAGEHVAHGFHQVGVGGGIDRGLDVGVLDRSEEHTSELQSLMRISYAVFCLKTKTTYPETLQRGPQTDTYTYQHEHIVLQ